LGLRIFGPCLGAHEPGGPVHGTGGIEFANDVGNIRPVWFGFPLVFSPALPFVRIGDRSPDRINEWLCPVDVVYVALLLRFLQPLKPLLIIRKARERDLNQVLVIGS
jgi:hypothetical protein